MSHLTIQINASGDPTLVITDLSLPALHLLTQRIQTLVRSVASLTPAEAQAELDRAFDEATRNLLMSPSA